MNNELLNLINSIDTLPIHQSITFKDCDFEQLKNKNELLSKLETSKTLLSELTRKVNLICQDLQKSLQEDYESLKVLHNLDHRTVVINHDNVRYSKVDIDKIHYIDAIIVDSFDDVEQDGHIYYVEPNKHFAFVLNGKLYHGNIGKVVNDKSEGSKLKTCINPQCKNDETKRNECSFYHNPLLIPDSTDIRNFYKSYHTLTSIGTTPELISARSDKVVHDILTLHMRSYF